MREKFFLGFDLSVIGFGFSLDNPSPSFANTCMTVDNDGTWYGYTQSFGELTSTTLKNGQTITEMKAKADGSWVIKIDDGVQAGETGNYIDEIHLVSDDGDIIVILVWDSVSGTYITNDEEEAADLIAQDGNEVCLGFYLLVDLLIDITFEELEDA